MIKSQTIKDSGLCSGIEVTLDRCTLVADFQSADIVPKNEQMQLNEYLHIESLIAEDTNDRENNLIRANEKNAAQVNAIEWETYKLML